MVKSSMGMALLARSQTLNAPFMNRSDPAPSSSELGTASSDNHILEDQINLIQVRPGLTPVSQTQLTDFKLYPTPYGLEMRLPLHRLRGDLMATAIADSAAATSWLTLRAVVGMTLLVAIAVLLTGSAVFGAILAMLLPALLWSIGSVTVPYPSDLILRLVNSPDGRTFLSLSQLSNSHLAKRNVVYLANLPVQMISAEIKPLGGQVNFTLYAQGSNPRHLSIKGNRQEVRWLHARIVHWGKGPARHDRASASIQADHQD
jgi:hypothetical protein